jgi:hypothetical protein
MKSALVTTVLVVVVFAAPVAAQPQGPLASAKDLYASARYDEALAILDSIRAGDAMDRRSVEQYRSLCLLALGRASEAESAIASLVTADPTYRPGEADASPRVRATFAEVRRRLLPEIATARYKIAKETYDRREWAAAAEQFTLVLSLIDDPDAGGRLADLRVLTAGFLELSERAAAPPPEPKPEPVPAPPAVASSPPAAPAVVRAPQPDRPYTVDDDGVIPPVVVRQEIPGVPASMLSAAKARGVLEVVIDEQGRSVAMTIRTSIHPAYDTLLLAAARDFKYRPAMFEGRPVKFRKLIQVSVRR